MNVVCDPVSAEESSRILLSTPDSPQSPSCSRMARPTLPVRWRAPFYNPSGYASEAINFVLPLADKVKLGIQQDNNLYSEKFVAGLPSTDRDMLAKLESNTRRLSGGFAVSHNPANGFTSTENAEYNIGRTMFETDRIPESWVRACNLMDEIWVPSVFNKQTFIASGVESDKLVIIPGAVNEHEFDPARHQAYPIPRPAKFNFLAMFEWIRRKGWDVLLASYFKEFSAEDDVCLYLRTYLLSQPDGDPSEVLREKIKAYARTLNLEDKPLPRVEILPDQVPTPDLPRFYKAFDCLVAPSRGEGWGRPHHEAMTMGVPVIATNWSGNTAFMNEENSFLLEYEMSEINEIEPIFWDYKGHRWADPSASHLQKLMRRVEQNKEATCRIGQIARKQMIEGFGREAVSKLVCERLTEIERKLNTPVCPADVLRSDVEDSNDSNEVAAAVSVAWEGDFLDYGSLSHVNREFCSSFSRISNLHVTRVGNRLAPRQASQGEDLKQLARQIQSKAPGNAQVSIRHSWPPKWDRPSSGAWILMQPWEYGALPENWANSMEGIDEIWAYSNYVRRVYIDSGIAPKKVRVVPLGVDIHRFHRDVSPLELKTNKSFKFLFVGGTIHRKGPDLLLKAYLDSFTALDDVCLVIKDFGGKSVYAGQTLEAQIKQAQSDPNTPEILYLTEELSSKEIAGLYTACDVLVHPYRGEGFGLPVLEAMACGLPVIVTAGGSTDDFADDQHAYRVPAVRRSIGRQVGDIKLVRNGWLLEPSLEALGERMRWTFEHPVEARQKGLSASEYVSREWNWNRSAEVAARRIHALARRKTAQRSETEARRKQTKITADVPAVAELGSLVQARTLMNEKRFKEAWVSGLEAIRLRPFHPEAFLALSEIAEAAGDAGLSQKCFKRAKALAPRWKAVRRQRKGNKDLINGMTSAWPALPKPNKIPTLSVCLIVKNEEKHISRCLASIKGLADQIIVVDTGSSDRTVEIAKTFGAEVRSIPWEDHFSKARNVSLEGATGDWILILDADEELSSSQHTILRNEIEDASVMAYRMPIYDKGNEGEGCHYVPRLFRNAPSLFFEGRIHEQIFNHVETLRQDWKLENSVGTAAITHYGYSEQLTKDRDKIARNLKLLELAIRESPNDPHLLMNLGLELARSGNIDSALKHYLEAFKMLSSWPSQKVVPELREALLTQFCTYLMAGSQFGQIISVLQSPLGKSKLLTASMHFMLGMSYFRKEQYKEAIMHFQKCIETREQKTLSPILGTIRQGGPWHCLAMAYDRMEQEALVEHAFQKALADEPDSSVIRFDFAKFLVKSGSYENGSRLLQSLLAAGDMPLESWINGCQVSLSAPEMLGTAIQWIPKAQVLFPNDETILQYCAELLLLTEQIEMATTLWVQISEIAPKPKHQAAALICRMLSHQPVIHQAGEQENEISQAFIRWYRRLIQYQAEDVVRGINQDLAQLEGILPTATRLLNDALKQSGA